MPLFPALLVIAFSDDPPIEPLVVEDKFGRARFTVPDEPRKSVSKVKAAPREAPAPIARLQRCPAGMIYIAGSRYENRPIMAFCLDAQEVTVEQFAEHLSAMEKRGVLTKKSLDEIKSAIVAVDWPALSDAEKRERGLLCSWPQARKSPKLPMNCVSYAQAEAYCAAFGKRLPGEREWRWAARGRTSDWTYPWGKRGPADKYANMADANGPPRLLEVRTLKPSMGGLYDMGGNVWEWVASDLDAIEYVAHGGGFRSKLLREMKVTATRRVETRHARSDDVGFRCAATVLHKERDDDVTPRR